MNKGQFVKGHKGYWKGKKMSQETKDKMSVAREGKKHPMPEGYVVWNKGKKASPETIKKLIESHKGQKAWNKLNRTPEEFRAVKRKYRKDNPYQFKVYDHNKRARRKGLTKETVQRVYEDNIKRFGTLTCYLCLKPIKFGKDTLEHKTPLIRGGSNEYDNLGIACKSCNCKKNRKTVEEYSSDDNLFNIMGVR